jgi:hypothetical protein
MATDLPDIATLLVLIPGLEIVRQKLILRIDFVVDE